MKIRLTVTAIAVSLAFVTAPATNAATSLDEVLSWYEEQSEDFFDSLDGNAYRFLASGGTVLGSISISGSRDPRGDARMTVRSPFLSGKVRCVSEKKCWFRPAGKKKWERLDRDDVTVDSGSLEITADQVREILQGASVVSFDPGAGRAELQLDDEGRVTIVAEESLIRFVSGPSVDGTVEEAVVEIARRSDFRVKAPPRRLQADSSVSYDFEIPGVPGQARRP